MLSDPISSFQEPPRNCVPRSVVSSSGTPYRGSQCRTKARQQELEDISGRGIASGQRLNRSTTVRRYFIPSHSGNGPTRSTCIWPNRRVAAGNTVTGALMCLPIFDLWQRSQVRHHARTSERIPGQTKLEEICFRVGRVPEWLSPCRASKTALRNERGTSGRGRPIEVSHHNVTSFQ